MVIFLKKKIYKLIVQCDCGYNPNIEDLKKARCQTCGANVIEKENENLYIKLTKLQKKIEKYYEQNKKNWRKNSQNETQKYLTQGLIIKYAKNGQKSDAQESILSRFYF